MTYVAGSTPEGDLLAIDAAGKCLKIRTQENNERGPR